ncbi:hypothetical protein K1F50_19690 [Muricauda oceani]|uniref:Lipoprotein n=1 Tax=Flagellimonas oceani TaxID=2698672 RepID=A0A6G7J6H5_9FLAO|nr:hypothetical protein [Allomuricauda oceani]MBW8245037.1 hypothetical protein [Allomuricauda oceani]QII46481.1 hypothetical protein GVT53_17920 [Allomuricauda oceani]
MKREKFLLPVMFILTMAIGLTGCEQEVLDNNSIEAEKVQAFFDHDVDKGRTCMINEEEPISPIDFEGSVTLGEPIKIPQTVQNMQYAWEKLQERELYMGTENPVKVNKLYVRFLPKSKEQLLELSRYDSSLDLFDFPLHYNFEPTSDHNDGYRDRTLPLEAPNPMYTVVDHDYVFPITIDHEVFMELYMPDEDRTIQLELADALEAVAENLAEGTDAFKGFEESLSAKKKKWRPEGRIRVIDHAAGEPTDGQPVPVAGAQVLARRGLKWSWGTTDEQGEFRVKKDFKHSVEYSVRWSNHEWYIIKGSGVIRAWYFGPNKKSDWDAIINGSIQSFYAQIHRAAYHSFYGENYGITRPMHNKPGNDRIWIRAYNRPSKFAPVAGYFYNLAPHSIWVYGAFKDENKEKGWFYGENYDVRHDELARAVLHEFGHASHRNLHYINDELNYSKSEKVVRESWAMGVEGELIKAHYPIIHKSYLGSTTCEFDESFYRYIVKDLLYPEKDNNGFDSLNPNYESHFAELTLKDLENAFGNTWEEWRDNLKQGLPKAEADNVQGMFDYWSTACD